MPRLSVVFCHVRRVLQLVLVVSLCSLVSIPSAFADWPAQSDQSLPMGGVFYGNPYSGVSTGNTARFYYEASRRFRAERSGYITAVKFNNRTILRSEIKSRCKSSGGGWCGCAKGRLDHFACGYHLSNGYSQGNGGRVSIELRADDGTNNHFPSDEVLGRITKTYVPLSIANKRIPTFEFRSPVYLEAGEIYHLVFKQLNPPRAACRRGGLSVRQAAKCDRKAGSITLNGVSVRQSNGHHGPFLGRTAAALIRNAPTSTWSKSATVLPWYEIRYDDGTWTGDNYTFSGVTRATGTRPVYRRNLVRQQFLVQDADRKVTGVWIWISRTSNDNSGRLVARLTNNNRVSLALASIPASNVRKCGTACGHWVYAKLSKPRTLFVGRNYYLELSARGTAAFQVSAGFESPYGIAAYGEKSRNAWHQAQIQYSRDAGKTWRRFTNTYQQHRDMGLVFTLDGMPTSLP